MSYGLLAFAVALLQLQGAACLNFSFSSFPRNTTEQLILTGDAEVVKDAIQVTRDVRSSIENLKGRACYHRPFRLWKRRSSKSQIQTASFNSTFVLNITPQTHPGGEGLAFILSGTTDVPAESEGQWLGIVNATTNGTAAGNVVAVEFDTKKSFPQDLDDNHVGLSVNSVYSVVQTPLWNGLGVNASNGTDFTARVEYDGVSKTMTVYVGEGRRNLSNESLAFSRVVDLPSHLPEVVYVGFSASTGKNTTELNCVRAWDFTGTDIDDDTGSMLWLWITIPAVIVCSVAGGLAVICYCFYRRRQFKKIDGGEEEEYSYDHHHSNVNGDPMLDAEIEKSGGARKFRYKEIESATGSFAASNELGRGGFGTVYRGDLADGDNQVAVAVKRFSKRSANGRRDFVAEVKTIGKLHHKNLVKLVGWCHEGDELLLVYEFMPNGSLDAFIFPTHPEEPPRLLLPWGTRHSIICDVATGLDYLHTGCDHIVLHRDIKASNILLDSQFHARLGDFGLARTILPSVQTHHSTTDIAGTPGYMAPESFHIGRATPETDVYAFGVVVLEVVCGRKPGRQSEGNSYTNGIVEWVWGCHQEDRVLDVLDGRLTLIRGEEEEAYECDAEQVKRTLVLGLACCHPNPHCRPSIKAALQVLTGEAPTPTIPVKKPTFMWPASPAPPCLNDDDEEGIEDTSFTGGQLSPSTTLSAR